MNRFNKLKVKTLDEQPMNQNQRQNKHFAVKPKEHCRLFSKHCLCF